MSTAPDRPNSEVPGASLDVVRRFFAEEIRAVAGLASEALVAAFSRVPRERFLGPGPWQLSCPGADGSPTRRGTADADPRHLYHNVSVSLDPARELWNGQPGTIGGWIERLEPRTGERVLHVGCGPGYYTAILAEMVGSGGRVTAVEIDPELAARARAALEPWPQVEVLDGDGATLAPRPSERILINAGATHPRAGWLDGLVEGGRMVLPLTFDSGPADLGKGGVLAVDRRREGLAARFFSMVLIYPCLGSRDAELDRRLASAYRRGDWMSVRSLRRDSHAETGSCWLHGEGFCLSREEVA